MDPFETRLAALIQAHTEPAERPIDVVAVARASMSARVVRRSSSVGLRFVGMERRRAWLLALVAFGLLAALAVAIIGSRPTSSEPTIEKLVYVDPEVGLLLEDPPGSTPKVIVPASGPGGATTPCFLSDALAGRSTCWSWVALSPSGRYVALRAAAAGVISILTLDGYEVASVAAFEQDEHLRWSPVEDVMAISAGVELRIVDANGQVIKRIDMPVSGLKSVQGWSPDGRHVLVDGNDVLDLWRSTSRPARWFA